MCFFQARPRGRPLIDVFPASDDPDVRGRAGDRPGVHAARHRPRSPQRPRQRRPHARGKCHTEFGLKLARDTFWQGWGVS